jgi:uncharacterized protein YciI
VAYFLVLREAGPGWVDGGIERQTGVAEHAAFMNALAADGFVLCAGPVGGSEAGRLRALLIVQASSEAEILGRLADDPWAATERLQVTSVDSWQVLVGAERLLCGTLA